MQPLIVLVLMPVVVGGVAAVVLRDLRRASLAATLLVCPLTLAFSLAAVVTVFGHGHLHRRPHP